jgi:ribose transport system permease protein
MNPEETIRVPFWRILRRATGSRTRTRSRVDLFKDYSILGFLLALFVFLALTSPVFLTTENLSNVLDQSVAIGLLSCAGGLVIMGGGFDLSAGAIYVLAAVLAAKVSNATNAEIGIAAGVVAGMALGAVNAIICTIGRINAFVATLATSIFFSGAATAITGGGFTYINDQNFGKIATKFFGISVPIIIFAVFAIACAILLNKTVYGRHLLAAGDNAEAASLSGVSVDMTRVIAYILSGFAAGLAGVVVAGRSLSVGSTASAGNTVEFAALAAILVGGVSMLGGEGAIWRILTGVLILAFVANGFDLNGVNPLYQSMMSGVLILLAVGADVWVKASRRK